jgi:putative intracellular protease/amidase
MVDYACPPCGCTEDGKHFDAAGTCSLCNMAYVSNVKGLEDKPRTNSPRRTAAIVLFDMADIMDVTGPMSVFEHAGFNIVTVAKDMNPKTIGMYTPMQPNYTFDNLPDVDVIMVPGGGPAESNQDMDIVNWLKERDNSTDTMFSVCSGAFFLGLAGILDGNEATTFASLIPNLKEQFPKAKVLNNVKYTNNGHVITSSGLSSGIDASFEVVAKYYGIGAAQDIANRMEYPWKRRNDYARTQLADNYINGVNSLMRRFSTKYTYSEGDMNSWEYRFILWEGVDSKDFLSFMNAEMNKIEGFKTNNISNNTFSGIYNHKNLGVGEIILKIDKTSEGNQVTLIAERKEKVDTNATSKVVLN